MDQLTWLGLNVRLWLTGLHPAAPWFALALGFYLLDYALERLGWDRWIERSFPWGKLATAALSKGPLVVLGAMWPLLTSADPEMASAVGSALEALARPLVLAVGAWLSMRLRSVDGPPSS